MAVIWYDSSETGAPVLNNAAGSLLSVVQACLVDGFNSKSVTSIVVVANVATVTVSAHGYSGTFGKLLRVAGATPAGLNGDKQPTVTGANTFTFPAPGVSDQTATGTITVKRAALDWVRQFTGTNRAVYKSTDPAGSGALLRIDDTNAGDATPTDARAVMYESMTSVDTGIAPGPTSAQIAGGSYWIKGGNNTTAKSWTLFGDGRLFYLVTQITNHSVAAQWHCFGDPVSYRAGDPFSAILGGAAGASGTGAGYNNSPGFPQIHSVGGSPALPSLVVARVAAGTGVAVRACAVGLGSIFGVAGRFDTPAGYSGPAYPSPVDSGIVISRPVFLSEENATFGNPIRGELPGLAIPLSGVAFTTLEVVTGLTGFSGAMLAVPVSGYYSGTHVIGRMMADISGPWR